MLVFHQVSFRIDGAEELIVLVLDTKVDDLSSDDHQEDQMLEDVHEVVLGACVILGQSYLGEVLLLLQKVVVEGHIPTQWLSKLEQKVLVLANKYEAGSIWVKLGPHLLEMLANVCTHEFVLSLGRLLEGLQDNGDEQLHEDCANQKRV